MTILLASRTCDCGQPIQQGEQFGLEDGIFYCEDCLTKPETDQKWFMALDKITHSKKIMKTKTRPGTPTRITTRRPPACPGIQEYRVVWEIDLEATSPKDAARNAWELLREKDSTACFFTVTRKKKKWVVDLQEE